MKESDMEEEGCGHAGGGTARIDFGTAFVTDETGSRVEWSTKRRDGMG